MMTGNKTNLTGLEIAVIGMAGRFPGAKNIEEYWDNLRNGRESITFFTDEELIEAGVDPALVKQPNYVKAKGYLEGIEDFDAGFFDYSPRDVEVMDPQMRLFHEVAFEALENAGYNPENYKGKIGVYAGNSANIYWINQHLGRLTMAEQHEALSLNFREYLSPRISYKLNLKGPSVTVQTACSTSLSAIHLACQGLLSGEANLALAGGVTVTLPNKTGYLYQEGMIMSPDGHCRAFDAEAKGTIFGSGAGVVVLKRLEDAINDGDYIYAVVKGSAINNDGIQKVGFTAPSIKGQAAVIRAAQYMAEVEPESITYVETHGTGTILGDPIEIEALKRAFRTEKKRYCRIGSVKTNIGHLEAAAGAAAFIKTALALKHRQIPPSLNFTTPNPKIDFENSPFAVNTRLIEWRNENYPLRAGVSSFGIGGSNAHAVLEEAPAGEKSSTSRPWQMLLLSAKTPTALEQATANLADYLTKNPETNLADAAYTLQIGRRGFKYRRAVLCRDSVEAVQVLRNLPPEKAYTGIAREESSHIIFMFAGQGSQYVNMGKELYQNEPVFKAELDRCSAILQQYLGYDLREILYPAVESEQAKEALKQTTVIQPAIFTFEYALAKLMMAWGIKPSAMIGYSFGEYVAACLAGVFSLEDALMLIALRGQLMQKVPAGAMLSVPLSETELRKIMPAELFLAVVNGPSCIVSGSQAAIDKFEEELRVKGLMCMRPGVALASHSGMMDSILDEFGVKMRQVELHAPEIPYISNVTGKWVSPAEVTDPLYWVRHLRDTVRFADGVQELAKDGQGVFVEIGPGRDLSVLVRRYVTVRPEERIFNLTRHPQMEVTDFFYLLSRISKLWLTGQSIDWNSYYAEERRLRIPLPTYPFERKRYWVEGSPEFALPNTSLTGRSSSVQKKKDIGEWFYTTSWERSPVSLPMQANEENWLIFAETSGLSEKLAFMLQHGKSQVISVRAGQAYGRDADGRFTINPEDEGDYAKLLRTLTDTGQIPTKILHLWSVGEAGEASFELMQQTGFDSLIYLARAIRKQNWTGQIVITAISSNVQDVTGEEELVLARRTLLAPVMVIGQEYPNLVCRSVDLTLPVGELAQEKLANLLKSEVTGSADEQVVAYRGGYRWVQAFKQVYLGNPDTAPRLREGGVYLITGGLGNIGLILAKCIAEKVKAKLILTGRSTFPRREEWANFLQTKPLEPIAEKIRQLQAIEKLGTDILIYTADAADEAAMWKVVEEAEAQLGAINGVIHAAGIISEKAFHAIDELSKAHCLEQFRPKVFGLQVLQRIFRERELDFGLLISSLSTILGGLGHVAYSAANLYMDAFVQEQRRRGDSPWLSINWEVWNFGGEQTAKTASIGASLAELATTVEEGVETFGRILAADSLTQLIVSTGELQARIDQWIKLTSLRENLDLDVEPTAYYARPALSTSYQAPVGELETLLTEIWRRCFGVKEIGVTDDFFELGGDSLKAINVALKIHEKFNVEIPLTEFFAHPNITWLARYIESAEKSDYTAIEPVGVKEYYKLSAEQKRIFVLQHLGGNNTVYNLPVAVVLEGELERHKLEYAFSKLISRHEALRTSFALIDGEPVQKIWPTVEFAIEYLTAEEKDVQGIIEQAIKPFDLASAPLMRVVVIEVASDRHILFMDLHHIISDGVSTEVFVRDFMACYDGLELPPLRLQYKDYSEWQNAEKTQETLQKEEAFWLNEFSGELPVLNLPCDYNRPEVQSYAGNSFSFELGPDVTGGLRKLGLEEDATLYMVIFTIWNVVLSKISGQEDIVVGTAIAGRKHPDLQEIMGMFVNTLALRNFPKGEKSFSELLGEVRVRMLRAYENQEYQFGDLVEKVAKRDASRNPLFDVMFVAQNIAISGVGIKGLQLKPYGFESHISMFDLRLMETELEDKLIFTLEYRTELFKAETVEHFAGYFKAISAAVVQNKAIKLQEIKLVHDFVEAKSKVLADIQGDFGF